jgi:integrase
VGVDPVTGRRLDRSITVRGNRSDAERELADMVARIRCVRAVGSRSTMSELFEAWFATAVGGWSPSTVRQNRSVLDCHLHRQIGSVVVGDVTPALIDAWYVRLRRGDNDTRPLAPATVARIHVVMSSAFSQAMRWGWVWDNPASRAHRIVVPTNEMRPPTPAELESLLEFVAPRDRQLELFLTLAAVTGARRAQLLGLRWGNISLAARRISFCAGWVEGPDGPVLAPTKTKRRHVVDLDEQSCRLLANRAAASCSSREAFIFSDDDGATAWKPNRERNLFSGIAGPLGWRRSDFTTSAISWPPRCSMPACRWWSFRAGSTTSASQQPSTGTRTQCPGKTNRHRRRSGTS